MKQEPESISPVTIAGTKRSMTSGSTKRLKRRIKRGIKFDLEALVADNMDRWQQLRDKRGPKYEKWLEGFINAWVAGRVGSAGRPGRRSP